MVKTDDLDKNNIEEIDTKIEVPENIIFLENSTKKERKNAKNIFLEYLPIEKKIKLKNQANCYFLPAFCCFFY